MRDRSGNYDVQIPTLQPHIDENQVQEEEGVEEEGVKIDAMLMERYKNRTLQPGEAKGDAL